MPVHNAPNEVLNVNTAPTQPPGDPNITHKEANIPDGNINSFPHSVLVVQENLSQVDVHDSEGGSTQCPEGAIESPPLVLAILNQPINEDRQETYTTPLTPSADNSDQPFMQQGSKSSNSPNSSSYIAKQHAAPINPENSNCVN